MNKLYYDKYKILSDELKKKIKLEIKEIITPKKEIKYPFSDNIIEPPKTTKKTIKIKNQDFELPQKIKEHINYTNSIKDKKSLYRITHVLNEFANDGLLDLNYCYVTVRKALCEENFLSLTSHNKMAPTENSLQKKYLLIGNVRTELDGEIYCSPIYVTNEGTALQILLMLKGYNPNGVESPGSFGSGCKAALKKYQKANGLTVDGIAGYNTFISLIS
ncbi:peptidoglycan-binding protein [Fusicatenibacter sp. CLA-AA-H241]|nr:peptidoglycan-binding protein [Oliverpabstia intestinalis]